MGDAAAVAVTKFSGGKNLSGNETAKVLLIINMAFAAPKIVEIESDREPRTSLFVLKSLDSSTTDPELEKRLLS